MTTRPNAEDYAPFYGNYIALVNDDPILDTLNKLKDSTYNFFCSLTITRANYAYAEGKWTIKEVWAT
jgi:hypothetical protein